MEILIVGGGRLGGSLAAELDRAGHKVTVVEKSVEVANALRERLPTATVVQGDGDEPVILESVHISRAEVVVAMTHEDEDNLVTCLLARREYGVAKTFARVNTPANEWLFGERFGVDEWLAHSDIEPQRLAAQLTAFA